MLPAPEALADLRFPVAVSTDDAGVADSVAEAVPSRRLIASAVEGDIARTARASAAVPPGMLFMAAI
jgi:hypothetical protein